MLHVKIKTKISKTHEINSDVISKFTNQLIDKINNNLERFNYNVIIASMYETYNFFKSKN